MGDKVQKYLSSFFASRKEYSNWLTTFICLALAVVLTTSAILTLSGVALTDDRTDEVGIVEQEENPALTAAGDGTVLSDATEGLSAAAEGELQTDAGALEASPENEAPAPDFSEEEPVTVFGQVDGNGSGTDTAEPVIAEVADGSPAADGAAGADGAAPAGDGTTVCDGTSASGDGTQLSDGTTVADGTVSSGDASSVGGTPSSGGSQASDGTLPTDGGLASDGAQPADGTLPSDSTLPADGTLPAAGTQPVEENPFPAQTFEAVFSNLTVHIEAGEGAFPRGTTMTVTPIRPQEIASLLEDAVASELEQVQAVDISFFNLEGEKIEPLLPIRVVMQSTALGNVENPEVVHISDEGLTEVMNQIAPEVLEQEKEEKAREEAARAELAAQNADADSSKEAAAQTEPAGQASHTPSAHSTQSAQSLPAVDSDGSITVQGVSEDQIQLDQAAASSASQADPAASVNPLPVAEVNFDADHFSIYAIVGKLDNNLLTTDGTTYRVSLTYGADAQIPEGSVLYVGEVFPEDYEAYKAAAAETIGTAPRHISYARFFDLSIWKDGEEIHPAAPVDVKISLLTEDALENENNDKTTANVVHFGPETEVVTASTAVTEPAADSLTGESRERVDVSFGANGFSVYGVVYTVDFHYEVDGKVYDFSIPGGGFVSFTDLVEVLGITDDTKKFVADVENVEFSIPSLVDISRVEDNTTVGQIKENRGLACEYSTELTEEQIAEINAQSVEAGDWALISLQPFESEESLTVTMKDGEVFTIKVTDGQMHTYVISDSGDTYEVIVTYDDTAEIPDDAELKVREIKDTEEEYNRNIEAANRELQSQEEQEVVHPVQFDIAIVSGGAEVEPKEGSIVKVEIRLVPEVFACDPSEEPQEEGEIWVNGEKPEQAEDENVDEVDGEVADDEAVYYTVAHIADDGTVEIIEVLNSSVDEDEKIILQFDTDSFSTYIFDGVSASSGSHHGNLNDIPSQIYVGDVIYMWNRSESVNANGHVQVTSIGNQNTDNSNQKRNREVKATSAGSFQIGNRWIEVLPERNGSGHEPATIDTVDNTSIGLTLNLFDYDLNDYLDSYFNGSSHNENPLSTFAGSGINSNKDLKFWGSGIGNTYGQRNQYFEHGVTSIVETNLDGGTGGYPKLRNSTQDLAYLFTPSNGTDKEAYTNVKGLFKKVGDYYVYDSNENYAYYDKSQGNGGSFAVYESTYEQKSNREQNSKTNGKAIGFFPFHQWDEEYDLYVNWNKNLNHHFGMSMSVPFSLPKDPKDVVDTNGDPIIFEFSGDDDLWVFIDGKLAMDIGGIHQPTSGTINFRTGVVTVNGQTQLTANQFNNRFPNLYDGNQHTLQVFYIERGGCDSNCMIKFNLTLYGDIHFDKVDEDNPSDKLAGAVFGLYKDVDCTIPVMERLKNAPDRAYIAESDANGRVQFSDIPIGTYYLKELHAPEGYPLDDTVHTVQVYYDQTEQQVKIKVTIDGVAVENGVKITNKKPTPITLGLQKVWQNADEDTIAAPAGAEATFEIKRIRTYETYTEQTIEGSGRPVSHLTVGWIHNGQTHIHAEYDLIAETQTTVSWGYKNGYEGTIGYVLNGTQQTKPSNPNNVYSQAFNMPAAGGSATFYVIDNSENGEAIRNINVAGQQFYGNSGGGVIHTFTTHTEPDPDFSYTGEHVTNNQVTLPINSNTWNYTFANLPTFESGRVDGVDHDVSFNYSYYLEEVSNNSVEGTTVVYKDLSGKVINSPTDAETSTSGSETIINRIPFGYLKIEKKVTYNGSDQDLTTEQKSKLAGEYKFKIYSKEQCADADAVQDPDAPNDAEDKDLIVTINIDTNGQAVSSGPVKLLLGNYWIKEVESSNPMMFPVQNPIAVAVTKDHTTSSPVIKTLTNNYDENNGPDKISIDIEKIFQGLDSSKQVPSDFQVLLQYKVNGQTKYVTLQNRTTTGENGETITWSKSNDGFIWHWHVGNIDTEAKEFKIKESNYDKAIGYDWKDAFLDTVEIKDTVNDWHNLNITAPKAELSEVTNDRRTSDSHSNTEFYLDDTDVLLSKLTGNTGTLVISKHPLNLMERDAVKKGLPNQFKDTCIFYSIDEHPDGFQFKDGKDNKVVTFGEKNGRATVKFTQAASAQESVWLVTYDSQEARNNANLLNTYEEVPITIDIVKVDQNNNNVKLSGAVFTIRRLANVPPTENGTLTTLDGTTPSDSDPTNSEGKTSFGNLTHGYYEITEKTPPNGYIRDEDVKIYFRIDAGVVTYLQRPGTGSADSSGGGDTGSTPGEGASEPSGQAESSEDTTGSPTGSEAAGGTDPAADPNLPSNWPVMPEGGKIGFKPAQEAVAADPSTGTEAVEASNAEFTVPNTPGAALPNAGGPGPWLLYLMGLIFAGAAAGGLLARRRL